MEFFDSCDATLGRSWQKDPASRLTRLRPLQLVEFFAELQRGWSLLPSAGQREEGRIWTYLETPGPVSRVLTAALYSDKVVLSPLNPLPDLRNGPFRVNAQSLIPRLAEMLESGESVEVLEERIAAQLREVPKLESRTARLTDEDWTDELLGIRPNPDIEALEMVQFILDDAQWKLDLWSQLAHLPDQIAAVLQFYEALRAPFKEGCVAMSRPGNGSYAWPEIMKDITEIVPGPREAVRDYGALTEVTRLYEAGQAAGARLTLVTARDETERLYKTLLCYLPDPPIDLRKMPPTHPPPADWFVPHRASDIFTERAGVSQKILLPILEPRGIDGRSIVALRHDVAAFGAWRDYLRQQVNQMHGVTDTRQLGELVAEARNGLVDRGNALVRQVRSSPFKKLQETAILASANSGMTLIGFTAAGMPPVLAAGYAAVSAGVLGAVVPLIQLLKRDVPLSGADLVIWQITRHRS